MNIKRSYLQLLCASTFVGLFLANCTVKESSSDTCTKGDKDTGCECPGGVTGYQVCNSEGVFGSCVCPGGTNTAGSSNAGGDTSSTAGKTSGTAGKSTTTTGGTGNTEGGSPGAGTATTNPGGADTGGASDGGAAGAGGVAGLDPTDCNACLQQICPTEFDACLADNQCISDNVDGSGQYERISNCIETARVDGLVKRDAVRGCGVTMGASTDADLAIEWAPEGMSINTTNLMNCLASAKGASNADWANDPNNYPVVNDMVAPTPWPSTSCAKLACTGKL